MFSFLKANSAAPYLFIYLFIYLLSQSWTEVPFNDKRERYVSDYYARRSSCSSHWLVAYEC